MAESKQIEIALAALGGDPGDVDFGTYLHALNSFKKYLSAIGSDLSKNDKIDWIVKDLHHSEPTILLEGRSAGDTSQVESVINTGVSALNLMATGKDAPDLNNDALNAVKDLMSDIGNSLLVARIKSSQREQDIDINFRHAFQSVKFANQAFEEEWEGMLEEINLHTKKKTFRLYPAAGPKYITCEFNEKLNDEVKDLLERKVSVIGEALYRPKSKYPHRIKAKVLTVLDEVKGELSLSKPNENGIETDIARLDNLRSGWAD